MAEYATSPQVGQGTEYTENFTWDQRMSAACSHNKEASGTQKSPPRTQNGMSNNASYQRPLQVADPTQFNSGFYPSVYRETTIRRDERGHYIDPFKNIASKPYGRRLMYDDTHPGKMYASQWNSELADIPGTYSFPTTTGLNPEIPWRKDMQWQAEGEVGQWPTDLWKQWEAVAECPVYDGHDDQVEYSKYKVQVP